MIPLEYMPPLMFGGLVLFMLIGFPVAFSLLALGLFFGIVSIELGFFGVNFLQAVPQRIFGSVLANDLLLAIPFFTFMGAILEKCGLAEEMLDSMGQLFGPIRGGLGYSVILVGFILGAITGTVAAQVITMAMISLPVMMRYGYNMRYTTGVLAASGTITQLVPPSLVLVVLADQLRTPTASADVGSMYLGAWGPSLVQIALFMLYTFFLSRIKPDWLPAIPKEARTLQGWALWKKCLHGIIPSAVLIFMVLGTMMLGVATPTESGAMGALGAVVLAVMRNKEFTRKDRLVARIGILGLSAAAVVGLIFYAPEIGVAKSAMPFLQAGLVAAYVGIVWLIVRASRISELRNLIVLGYQSTMRLTSMVVYILIGSTCFSVVFMGVDGGMWVEHLFTSLPGGWIGFLIVVNLFIFFLAFFLDFFEIAFIVVPMIAPVAQKVLSPVLLESMGSPEAAASAALVWFGVMLCVNMQTSFMHPPFGFALFYLRGVAPKEVKSSDIYWGALPWVALQLVMVALVIAFPQMVTSFLDKGVASSSSEGLVIERPMTDEGTKEQDAPQLDFSTESDKKGEEAPQLNFSTDTDKN
ncbi:TRAP transporter large permease subunit [Noviherbaspirillum cavernae]|uniref:TRAP transporter large permease subunit n=1 Tax=Noviherbaspirillum cavernae TaxID=2320862 RepID=A0A418WZX4_9BURK|nr:TRAP transporter large permease subunit [Noviherbaspirillum cavernae]RJG05643.1 TRAP transporter large permease subunit [Noviherbaspirillum cavernae]